jgi:ArsR family transcriptional regulator, arsenate/arsenite/antimonite-responsive transcriptional repressor
MISKAIEFSRDEQQIAAMAKALAHPARIAILKFLASKQDCMCGDIVDELPLAQSTVSQHLKQLKDAGLIKGEIDGPRVCYCVDFDALAGIQRNLDTIFTKIKTIGRKSGCC